MSIFNFLSFFLVAFIHVSFADSSGISTRSESLNKDTVLPVILGKKEVIQPSELKKNKFQIIEGPRSKESIVKVAHSQQGGLRFTYNQYIQIAPRLSGIVNVAITITSQGDVIEASIVSSTTGYPEFDNAILDKVKKWKWEEINEGNTSLVIPLTFAQFKKESH
jgi:TonB family protein